MIEKLISNSFKKSEKLAVTLITIIYHFHICMISEQVDKTQIILLKWLVGIESLDFDLTFPHL